jgi:hypothetical protein
MNINIKSYVNTYFQAWFQVLMILAIQLLIYIILVQKGLLILSAYKISVSVILTMLFFVRRHREIVIAVLSFTVFYILVPVMIERSGTIYIYSIIKSSNQVTQSDLIRKVGLGYCQPTDFTERRLEEGISGGYINLLNNGHIILSKKGVIITNIYEALAPYIVNKPIFFEDNVR